MSLNISTTTIAMFAEIGPPTEEPPPPPRGGLEKGAHTPPPPPLADLLELPNTAAYAYQDVHV